MLENRSITFIRNFQALQANINIVLFCLVVCEINFGDLV